MTAVLAVHSLVVPTESIRFVKELYPRLREDETAVERYRAAIDRLPPIAVARDDILVDGFHRWQAHRREGVAEIAVENLGNLSDAEIRRESIRRNASHGHQLTQADKRRLAAMLWRDFGAMPNGERATEIAELLSVSERSVQAWTKDARQAEKQEQQDRAWDLWLDCLDVRAIESEMGVPKSTVDEWLSEKRKSADFGQPPASRQHFDIWNFQKADGDSGFFGRMPPQVVENLLWLYTEPGDVVVDPFAGSGTTIEVAKVMGRRVWASDRKPSTPTLPIHEHDITAGWPKDAPKKARLILLDPPYWQQAKGRYSNEPGDLGNMALEEFQQAWARVIAACREHLAEGGRLAFIVSPTQLEDGRVVDHAFEMAVVCVAAGLQIERRVIVPYQTQQATGQQVEWARENRRLLKLYRDLVVMT